MVEVLATDSLAILGQARVSSLPGPAVAGTGNITLTVEGLVRERAERAGCNYCKSFITRQLKRVFLLHLVLHQALQVRAACLVTELLTVECEATDNSKSSC